MIELLVVISIITLMVAILLPTLAAARTAAHMSASLSNLRQIQLSQNVYAADQDGYLSPPARGAGGLPYWTQVMCQKGYVTSPEVFWSPARDTSMHDFGAPDLNFWKYPGYAVNRSAIPWADEMGPPLPVNPAKTRRLMNLNHADVPPASKFIVLVEAWRPNGLTWNEGDGLSDLMPRFGWDPDSALFSYNGGVPRAYMDGHANAERGEPIGWKADDQRYGAWTYTSLGQTRYQAPWYRDWENKWQ